MTVQAAISNLSHQIRVLEKKIDAHRIQPRHITIEQAMVRDPLCKNKVWEFITSGKVKTIKVGRRVFIELESWDELMDSFDQKIPSVD